MKQALLLFLGIIVVFSCIEILLQTNHLVLVYANKLSNVEYTENYDNKYPLQTINTAISIKRKINNLVIKKL